MKILITELSFKNILSEHPLSLSFPSKISDLLKISLRHFVGELEIGRIKKLYISDIYYSSMLISTD